MAKHHVVVWRDHQAGKVHQQEHDGIDRAVARQKRGRDLDVANANRENAEHRAAHRAQDGDADQWMATRPCASALSCGAPAGAKIDAQVRRHEHAPLNRVDAERLDGSVQHQPSSA